MLPIEVIALQPANETEVMVDWLIKAELAMLVNAGSIAISPVLHAAVGLLALTQLEVISSLSFGLRRKFELLILEISFLEEKISAKKTTEMTNDAMVILEKQIRKQRNFCFCFLFIYLFLTKIFLIYRRQ